MTKHKWHDVLVAIAECKTVQLLINNTWVDYKEGFHVSPLQKTQTDFQWRIKKEPVIEVVYFQYEQHPCAGSKYVEITPDMERWHLKITYQDGKAIKAELPNES